MDLAPARVTKALFVWSLRWNNLVQGTCSWFYRQFFSGGGNLWYVHVWVFWACTGEVNFACFKFGILPLREFGTILVLWYNASFTELGKAAREKDIAIFTWLMDFHLWRRLCLHQFKLIFHQWRSSALLVIPLVYQRRHSFRWVLHSLYFNLGDFSRYVNSFIYMVKLSKWSPLPCLCSSFPLYYPLSSLTLGEPAL